MKENAVVCVNLEICHEIECHSHVNDVISQCIKCVGPDLHNASLLEVF